MQINSQMTIPQRLNAHKSPNFTSVLRTRVFMDGIECAQEDMIKSVITSFNKVLRGPAKDNPSALNIIQKFARVVKDYEYKSGFWGFGKTQVVTRNYIDNNSAYIFSGIHANMINDLGKKIGPAKAQANSRIGSTHSFEVQSLTRNYFDKMHEFINNSKTRVFGKFDQSTQLEEVGLIISAKSNGKPSQKGFKFHVDNIYFEPIKKLNNPF